ncbi:hypothetical protein ACTFIR_012041 [Dictyostelium discoideum]
MSTNKKIKTDNNIKIFQELIDYEILRSIINYLLTSKKNNNNNNNKNKNNNNQYKINKLYINRNEILNYILVSKKWCSFLSLSISNNIINNKSFEHWLKIDNNKNKSFIENYNNNQNQYDKNNLIFQDKDFKQNKISFNKEFSIIKIKESIINDFYKFNLFLDNFTFNDFKEIKNKFENNQLLYNRIVVKARYVEVLYRIRQYIPFENSDIILNLFKILELNYDILLGSGYSPDSDEEDDYHDFDEDDTEIYFNNLSINAYDNEEDELSRYEESVELFEIFKGKNLIFDGSHAYCGGDRQTHFDYSALFDPYRSGQQVESIKVENRLDLEEFVEARHLIKVNQFENLHSITIPIDSYQIISNLYEEFPNISENMKSELNQMINSFITCKSLKILNILSVKLIELPTCYCVHGSCHEIFANDLNQTIESFSNSFKPLFSELNTSIERIELDSRGLLNINTFSNLLNNKSIKYLYLYGDSDFIVYLPKLIGSGGDSGGSEGGGKLHKETISINQYLFDNIFSSPLTSIRHYKIKFKESNQLKFIFNLILNNIFKLQLYSLIFELNKNKLVCEFVKEFKNLINNIQQQQQQQQQQQLKSNNNINLKEIKIKIKENNNEHIQELNNINNPYFTTVIKKLNKNKK